MYLINMYSCLYLFMSVNQVNLNFKKRRKRCIEVHRNNGRTRDKTSMEITVSRRNILGTGALSAFLQGPLAFALSSAQELTQEL